MRNMNKKKIALSLLTILLIGCTNSGNNNPDSEGEKQKEDENYIIKEDVEISFLSMVDNSYYPFLQAMINDFQLQEPHVHVNLSNPLGSGNYNTLERLVVAGFYKEDYPDIVQCYPDSVVNYLTRGYAVNLNPYIENQKYGLGASRVDYISSFMEEGQHYAKGGTYSLPFCKSTELMYYNADVLVGLDLSSIDATINNGQPLDTTYLDNLTWEELFNKLSPALYAYDENKSEADRLIKTPLDKNNNPTNGRSVISYDSSDNLFITLANQYGYGYTDVDSDGNGLVSFNNSNMKSLMNTFRTAYNNKYIQTRRTFGTYVSELFQNQNCLFTVSSTAGISYNFNKKNPFKMGVAKLPHAEGKEYTSINQGPSICVLKHDDQNRTLASFLLWKYITSVDNATTWSINTGYMPIRTSCFSTKAYIDITTITDKSTLYDIAVSDNIKKIEQVRNSFFNTPVFYGSGNVRTNVTNLITNCMNTDVDVDTLFDYYATLEAKIDYTETKEYKDSQMQ